MMAALLQQSSPDCRHVQLGSGVPPACINSAAVPLHKTSVCPAGVVLGTALPMSGMFPHAPGQQSSGAQPSPGAAPRYRVYNTYSVVCLFDTMIACGSIGLIICYIIARHYNHIGIFCDISDLVVHMPERVIFRLNFSIVGGTLLLGAFPVRDVVARRVGGRLPSVGAFFQKVSGVGVVLVAGCGPEECMWFHIVAAIMGFAGSAIAQIIYGIALHKEDRPSPTAKRLFVARGLISLAFMSSFLMFGLGQARVFPEPAEHIAEWMMWVFLLLWYYTFRFDMMKPGESFYIATVNEIHPPGRLAPLLGVVV